MPDQSDSHKHGRYVWRDGIRFELIDVADAIDFLRDAGEEAAATNTFWRTVSDWLDVRRLAQRVLEGSGQSQVAHPGFRGGDVAVKP